MRTFLLNFLITYFLWFKNYVYLWTTLPTILYAGTFAFRALKFYNDIIKLKSIGLKLICV